MPYRNLSFLPLLFLLVVTGCQASRPISITAKPASIAGKSADSAIRCNALALLGDLLGDEKHLSKILIIKRESTELNRLVKDISQTAGSGADLVEATAKSEPGLDLSRTDLPVGELATRKAIAKTKQHLILHNQNEEFEFQMLLTQSQAMSYGAHLAAVIAENTPNPERSKEFSLLAIHLEQLQERALVLLRNR